MTSLKSTAVSGDLKQANPELLLYQLLHLSCTKDNPHTGKFPFEAPLEMVFSGDNKAASET